MSYRGQLWPYFLDRILREEYPQGGAAACRQRILGIGYERSINQIRNRASRLGIRYERITYWNDEMDSIVRSSYPIAGLKHTLQRLKEGGYQVSEGALKSRTHKLGLKSGINHKPNAGSWRKGQAPPNKGKRMPEHIRQRVKHTWFKKGQQPMNTLYDGAIRFRSTCSHGRGSYWIRIAKGKWQSYHRWLWEQIYGPIPPGHIIYFKDGNHLNVTISNLGMMTKARNAVRNAGHQELTDGRVAGYLRVKKEEVPQELIEVQRQRILLNRQIKEHEEDK